MLKVISAMFLAMLIPFGAVAKESGHSAFPYGLLGLRGYAMEMTREGTFRIYSGNTVFVEGTFRVEGNRLTIADHGGRYACRGKRMNPGSYYWSVHDGGLYLMLIKDNCWARKTAFLEAPLKTDFTPASGRP